MLSLQCRWVGMICNSLSHSNYSLKGWAKLLHCPEEGQTLPLQVIHKYSGAVPTGLHFTNISPKPVHFNHLENMKKYINNETKPREWRLCCPTQHEKSKQCTFKTAEKWCTHPLTAHSPTGVFFGCQQRWFKKEKTCQAHGFTWGCNFYLLPAWSCSPYHVFQVPTRAQG